MEQASWFSMNNLFFVEMETSKSLLRNSLINQKFVTRSLNSKYLSSMSSIINKICFFIATFFNTILSAKQKNTICDIINSG